MERLNGTAGWPSASALYGKLAKDQKYDGGFGYPEGVSARDLAPPEVRHMVLEHFDKFPPADPRIHYMLGLLYIIIGLAASIGNFYVMKIFIKYKSLRSPSNLLIINLAFCDFMLFAGLIPELIINSFAANGIWMFGEVACYIHAWFGTTFGFGQMVTLSVISYDRYHVIVKGLSGSPPTYKRSALLLAYVWIISVFWGSSPLFGLGRFTLDGILSSCSYDYLTPNISVYSYIIGSWFNGFVFPIGQIIYSYFFIVKAVCNHESELREQAKKMNVKSLRSGEKDQGMSSEIRVAKIAMVNITLWLLAWMPFTVMSFVGLYDPMRITPVLSSLPVIIAKSSCVYNPIVYALSHPKYQECLRLELGWLCGAKQTVKNGDDVSCSTSACSATS